MQRGQQQWPVSNCNLVIGYSPISTLATNAERGGQVSTPHDGGISSLVESAALPEGAIQQGEGDDGLLAAAVGRRSHGGDHRLSWLTLQQIT